MCACKQTLHSTPTCFHIQKYVASGSVYFVYVYSQYTPAAGKCKFNSRLSLCINIASRRVHKHTHTEQYIAFLWNINRFSVAYVINDVSIIVFLCKYTKNIYRIALPSTIWPFSLNLHQSSFPVCLCTLPVATKHSSFMHEHNVIVWICGIWFKLRLQGKSIITIFMYPRFFFSLAVSLYVVSNLDHMFIIIYQCVIVMNTRLHLCDFHACPMFVWNVCTM